MNGSARASSARLIKKVFEFDPLTCYVRANEIRVSALINDNSVIRHILEHVQARELADGRTVKRALPVPQGQAKGSILLVHEWWGLV